MSLDSNEQVKL